MTRRQWFDDPATTSPVSAALLNDLEDRKAETAFMEINVKDPPYNAVGNGAVNDYVALQAALTAAGTAISGGYAGASVLLPQGVYRYTTELSVPPGISIRGLGRSSVLKPEGCDGLAFQVSNMIGPQRFEMFYMQGDNSYTQNAVKALGDADSGRVQGITFQDILISNFKTAFWLRSTHGWVLLHVTAIFVWEGIRVGGQTILLTVAAGSEFSRDGATGTGNSTGLIVDSGFNYNPGGVTERGPEGFRISDTTFFGFAYGIDAVRGLDLKFYGITCGLISNTGIQITSPLGGVVIRDGWIGYDNGALYGIHAPALGAPVDSLIVIDGMNIEVEAGMTTDVNSIGIALDSSHRAVIRNNKLSGARLHDIRLNFADHVTIEDNRCSSATAGASIQLVAAPGGPYWHARNTVATNVFEHGINTDKTIASAATIALPRFYRRINVTGTTTITSITAGQPDEIVTLIFAGALTVTDGSNLRLNGNFVTTADDTLTLISDGTNWIEMARSTN
jgi:hypothetical protein